MIKDNKIKVKRISSDGHLIEEGYLDLEELRFYPSTTIYSPEVVNTKCSGCDEKICTCKKTI